MAKGLGGYVNHGSGFMERNKTVIAARCKDFVEAIAKPRLIKILTQIATTMRDMIDGEFMPWPGGSGDYPVWFGQLHDSTGVAIYNNGSMVKFFPTKKALDSKPQRDRDNGISHIIGSEWLNRAMEEASGMCSTGLWIVLFSSVPYAAKINTQGSPRGQGIAYFDRLSDKELADIIFNLEMDPMFELKTR